MIAIQTNRQDGMPYHGINQTMFINSFMIRDEKGIDKPFHSFYRIKCMVKHA